MKIISNLRGGKAASGPKRRFFNLWCWCTTWAGVVGIASLVLLFTQRAPSFEIDGWTANAARFINLSAYIVAWLFALWPFLVLLCWGVRCWKDSWFNMKMFCWCCFARLLRLRLDRGWAVARPSRSNLNLPHTCSWSAAMLPDQRQRIPISNHCHASPMTFGNCTRELACHRPPNPHWPLLAPFVWNIHCVAKTHRLGHALRKTFHWTQPGKTWSILHVLGLWVAEFCGNSAAVLWHPVPHVIFVSKIPFFGLQCSQQASEVLRAISPLTATNLPVLAAWWIIGVATPIPEQKNVMADVCFMCVWRWQVRDIRELLFVATLEGFRLICACSETQGNIACCWVT